MSAQGNLNPWQFHQGYEVRGNNPEEEEQLRQTRFYHGTNAELKPGDAVDPYFSGKIEGSDRVDRGNAYFTTDRTAARWYAVQAEQKSYRNNSASGVARVYQVGPTGPFEDDTDTETLLTDEYPYKSKSPLEVKKLVEHRDMRDRLSEWQSGAGL